MSTTKRNAFVIPLAEKKAWTHYVSQAVKYDFYHTWDYQDLAKNGEPMLFVYEEKSDFIAIPLLKRAVPNSNYFDFHSVYGYTGPISNLEFKDLNERFILNFQACLLEFFKNENSISVFTKFHPFFNQTGALEKLGGVFYNGKTVAIDLKQPLEQQREKYGKSTLQKIKKNRNLGFTTHEMQGEESIVQFAKLYSQSMERVGASNSYFFDETYINSLLNSSQCNAKLLLVFFDGKVVCGSIITLTKGIIQAHLLATDSNYLKYSPAKFLVDEVCLMGRKLGMDYFHLGGGLSYQDDSLLDWKLSFSDLVLPHKSWRYIVNDHAYRELVEQTGNDINNPVDFFPLYRLTQPVQTQKIHN